MGQKIREQMSHSDIKTVLSGHVEIDEAYVGGKRSGKRGRGAAGKQPIFVAVERRGNHAGFMAATTAKEITKDTVRDFLQHHLPPGQEVKTDALPALNSTAEDHEHQKKVTPPDEAGVWLPMVHIIIGNLKTFLNGTFHGVSHRYLQDYISEFCYRFNRRFWEHELPMRLLNACLAHVPVLATENC